MPLLPVVAGGPGDQYNVTDFQHNHPLGSQMNFADGRRYRYARAAASAIATGKLCQQTLNDANFDELVVPTARAIGDKAVTFTNGATAVTTDLFKDGFLNVEDDVGEGHLYTVASNTAEASTGTVTVNILDRGGLRVAWTTATTICAFANPYGRVIIHPSPATAMLTGVTCVAVTASDFAWLQTWGPTSVLIEGTTVINEGVIDSASADGAVAPTASTAAGEEFYVGITMEVTATTEHGLINMRMTRSLEYDVEREPGQWHIREKGQITRGTTVTDPWLDSMGFGIPSRLNIQAIVDAVYASHGGVVLDEYAASRIPKDIPFKAGFKNYPDHPTRGRVPKNPPSLGRSRKRPMDIPDRMLFRSGT